jgi:Inovirus Coat protein B
MKKQFSRALLPAVGLLVAGAAQAAPVDVTALVADIGAQIAPITLVGGAVLLVMIAVRAFRWIRSAMA